MELTKANNSPIVEDAILIEEEISSDQFMHANTQPILNTELRGGCIIPVFSKDNESTISHSEFIETTFLSAQKFFGNERILQPAIRVSHPIKGRIPEAMGKPAKDLAEDEKTLYFERMAFVLEIPGIRDTVCGNSLSLTIGGVRAYNHENLYNRKTEEKFKVFVGFKNKVCTNLCVFTDGAYRELKVRTLNELSIEIFNLLNEFEPQLHLNLLKSFENYELSESQFAHLLGKARLFQHLPVKQKAGLQPFPLSDTQVGTVAREYYHDDAFSRNPNGSIDFWKLYNLFTGANKSSYIDTFLDRGAGCFVFMKFLMDQYNIGANSWYLNSMAD